MKKNGWQIVDNLVNIIRKKISDPGEAGFGLNPKGIICEKPTIFIVFYNSSGKPINSDPDMRTRIP